MPTDDTFNKVQSEMALVSDLRKYAENIGNESITAMATSIEEDMHSMFRFANQLEAQAKREQDRIARHMEEMENQEYKHGEQRNQE